MNVRRYFAPDMRSALAAARREQGADVMIIGQRRVDGGLELITAEGDEAEIMSAYTPRATSHPALVEDEDGEAAITTLRTQPASPAKSSSPSAPQATKRAAVTDPPKPEIKRYTFPQADRGQRPHAQPQSQPTRGASSIREAASTQDLRGQRPLPQAQRQRPLPQQKPSTPATSETLWTREPVMAEMHNELRSLRGLLQQQMATQAWSDMRQRHPLAAYLLRRAVSVGVSPVLAQNLVRNVPPALSFDKGWERLLALFAQRLKVSGDDLVERGGAAVLLGPTGVGKTSLVCKLAAQFALKHGSRNVALITTDSQRIGAHEQLRAFGRIMGIPVRVAAGVEELLPALDAVYDRKLVLIDTAGMSHRDRRLDVTLAALRDCSPLVRSYVVTSAATPARDLEATFTRYAPVSPVAVMLTKLDDVSYLAPALSAAVMHGLPVAYVSGGQRIPEDCLAASAKQLVYHALAAASAHGHVGGREADLMMEELFRGGDKAYARA